MTARQDTDELLMERIRSGDRGPIATLIGRWAGPLLTYLVRMLGDQAQAAALFGQIFLSLWMHRRRYQFPRPFHVWLFEIATKKCLYQLRRRRRAEAEEPPDRPEPDRSDPHPAPPGDAALAARALARLPTRERTVLVLRVHNGFSYADIARITGRHEVVVRTQMGEALAGIRRYWRLRGGDAR